MFSGSGKTVVCSRKQQRPHPSRQASLLRTSRGLLRWQTARQPSSITRTVPVDLEESKFNGWPIRRFTVCRMDLWKQRGICLPADVLIALLVVLFLQDLEEQKRTKYKINGTATTAIEKSNPNLPAKSRLPYSYPYSTLVVLVGIPYASAI